MKTPQQIQERIAEKVLIDRRRCRQMLGALLKSNIEPIRLPLELVKSFKKIFHKKRPIGTTSHQRFVDKQMRMAAIARMRTALDYVNEYGIGQVQNEDGTYVGT